MVHERGALAFFHHGYSLLVNNVERHWAPIARVARQLEKSFGLAHVSCNLYLTPPNASGFESHWDWMDAIVVQMSGEKIWSLWKEPTMSLSTFELKRQPQDDELQATRFSDFPLGQGDILYIPRGTLHNASTGAKESMHLTFGLEPTGCLVANWVLQLTGAELHPLIQNATNHLTILRRSLPVGKSWELAVDQLQAIFLDSVDQLDQFGLQLGHISWEEASAGLKTLRKEVEASRDTRWLRDDELRAQVGQFEL
jgi:ribosomal protein L16 Arg81 hydroxylase